MPAPLVSTLLAFGGVLVLAGAEVAGAVSAGLGAFIQLVVFVLDGLVADDSNG